MSDETENSDVLFEDVDGRFERDDEWSFPKSISIIWPISNEPTTVDLRSFCVKYFEAMKAVCSVVNDNMIEDYVASYPIIYMFRHSVELALKAAILHQLGKIQTGHDLSILVALVQGLPDRTVNWINELNRLDERSTGLRYPGNSIGIVEQGALMADWLSKTQRLHDTLMALSNGAKRTGKRCL